MLPNAKSTLGATVVACGLLLAACSSDASQAEFSQSEALADGVLTQIEFEDSLTSAVACMRDAGVEADLQEDSGGDATKLSYSYSVTEGEDAEEVGAAEAHKAVTRCRNKYYRKVDILWNTQNAEAWRAEDKEFYDLIHKCVEDEVGVDLDLEKLEQLGPDARRNQEAKLDDQYPGEFYECRRIMATEQGIDYNSSFWYQDDSRYQSP